jgi:hypothetical protein
MPFVFEYRRRYGEMKVEIVTEGRLIDIIKEGFDAGVHLTSQMNGCFRIANSRRRRTVDGRVAPFPDSIVVSSPISTRC